MQNCLGLFIRGFISDLQTCFSIVYLGLWISITVNSNYTYRDFIYVEIFNSIGWNLYEQACLGRFAVIKQKKISLKKF